MIVEKNPAGGDQRSSPAGLFLLVVSHLTIAPRQNILLSPWERQGEGRRR
jgi:hypothetical protein